MLNYNFLINSIKERNDVFSDNSILFSILQNIMKFSDDFIVITDNKYRVVFSNFEDICRGENLFSKFKLKENHSNIKVEKLRRSVCLNNKNFIFNICIEPFYNKTNEKEGFLFLLKDVLNEEKYKLKFNNLLNFLKHDLKTPMIAQIMTLKHILKSQPENELLEEVLISNENAYRILKNYIQEIMFDEKELKLSRKDVYISNFAENLISICEKIFKSKNNKINLTVKRNKYVYIDNSLLKEALINILYQINENCVENSTVDIIMNFSHQSFKIDIFAPYKNTESDFFIKQDNFINEYNKIAINSGLYMAKKIIYSHSGKINLFCNENSTVFKISIPA